MSRLSTGQSNDEIHTNFFPFPFRYLQRLKKSGRPLMFCLDSLASVAQGYIFSDISLHPIPPVVLFKILIHLSTSWMNRVSRIMCFSQYGLSERFDVWYTQSLLKP